MQLADDVAIIARSPRDLQALLNRWENYSATKHQETSLLKTEIAIFTTKEDKFCIGQGARGRPLEVNLAPRLGRPGECRMRSPLGLGEDHRTLNFNIKEVGLGSFICFLYLGFLFDTKESAAGAYTSRETAGEKALGATKSAVRDAPYLPFHRTLEIGESTIGGVFLYHSEIWAPFLPAHGSVLSRQFLSC